jgi:hypothetical protein
MPLAFSPSDGMFPALTFSQAAVFPLVRTAWNESPSLAVHLTGRFQYPRIHKEVRWLLLNFTAKAAAEPDALPVLIDGTLPGDVSFQLKVRSTKLPFSSVCHLLTMPPPVLALLGPCEPHNSGDLFLANLPEQPVSDPVRHEGSGEPFG